ncbi:MAG: hypothetical protein K2L23_02280, partial [Odoribacter sp.]|nr:hypothetical protein [Odoribacter sp.]
SCSKDDDDDNIHGKWTLVKDYLIDKDGEQYYVEEYEEGEKVYEFKKDGSVIFIDKDETEGGTESGTYTFKDGKLTITSKDEEDGETYTSTSKVEFRGNLAIFTATEEEEGKYLVMELKKY